MYYTVKSTRKLSSSLYELYEAKADQMTRPVATHIWTQCCVFTKYYLGLVYKQDSSRYTRSCEQWTKNNLFILSRKATPPQHCI